MAAQYVVAMGAGEWMVTAASEEEAITKARALYIAAHGTYGVPIARVKEVTP